MICKGDLGAFCKDSVLGCGCRSLLLAVGRCCCRPVLLSAAVAVGRGSVFGCGKQHAGRTKRQKQHEHRTKGVEMYQHVIFPLSAALAAGRVRCSAMVVGRCCLLLVAAGVGVCCCRPLRLSAAVAVRLCCCWPLLLSKTLIISILLSTFSAFSPQQNSDTVFDRFRS